MYAARSSPFHESRCQRRRPESPKSRRVRSRPLETGITKLQRLWQRRPEIVARKRHSFSPVSLLLRSPLVAHCATIIPEIHLQTDMPDWRGSPSYRLLLVRIPRPTFRGHQDSAFLPRKPRPPHRRIRASTRILQQHAEGRQISQALSTFLRRRILWLCEAVGIGF